MRKFRLSRLVLAATVIGVAGILTLPAIPGGAPENATAVADHSPISQVDWTNADQTYPVPPGSPTPSPSYDGDGTADPADPADPDDGDNGDGNDDPAGGGASPESGPRDDDDNSGGGLLDLAFPVQAGLSVGLIALAFLALLPGRRMPAGLR